METNNTDFQAFAKIPRFSRDIIVTEKIDGTNAQILIVPSAGLDYHVEKQAVVPGDRATENAMTIFAGSRTRWIQPGNDNYGFAAWVKANAEELLKLGPGRHFGEWWGSKINRAYGCINGQKQFSLFNVSRWAAYTSQPGVYNTEDMSPGPNCVGVVPTLYTGPFCFHAIQKCLDDLREQGSIAKPGFMTPEGIVIFHTASQSLFKKTLEGDESPKSLPGLTNGRQLAAGVAAANHVFKDKLADYPQNQ